MANATASSTLSGLVPFPSETGALPPALPPMTPDTTPDQSLAEAPWSLTTYRDISKLSSG